METLTLELIKLSLDAPLDQTGETLVLTSLVLPRPGIQQKTVLKPFRLQKGKALLSRKSFYQRALLKEKVEGPFGLTVQLTRPLANPELQNWFRSIAGLGLEATGDLLASGLSIGALRPLLREPFEGLADNLSDDAPEFILEGGFDLQSESLSPGSLNVPLQLTQRMIQRTEDKNRRTGGATPRHRTSKSRAKTYKKGLTIGEAVLKVRVD